VASNLICVCRVGYMDELKEWRNKNNNNNNNFKTVTVIEDDEMEEVSSTQVRKLLANINVEELNKYVHRDVISYLIELQENEKNN